MTEKQNLLLESGPSMFSNTECAGLFGIPGLKHFWKSRQLSFLNADKDILQRGVLSRKNSETNDTENTITRDSYQALSPSAESSATHGLRSNGAFLQTQLARACAGAPALIIAILLNLFFGVSFGQVFFPTSWIFPESVPRAIGVQVRSQSSGSPSVS